MHLIVTHAFGPHARGDAITDPAEMEAVLASQDAGHVVRIARLADEPRIEPAPDAIKE